MMSLIITTYPDGRVAWQDSGLTLVMTRDAVVSGSLTYAGRTIALDVAVPPEDPSDPLNGWKRRSAEQRSAGWRAKVWALAADPQAPAFQRRRKVG